VTVKFENIVRKDHPNSLTLYLEDLPQCESIHSLKPLLSELKSEVHFVQCNIDTDQKDISELPMGELIAFVEVLRVTPETKAKKKTIVKNDGTLVVEEKGILNIKATPIYANSKVAVNETQGNNNRIYIKVLIKARILIGETEYQLTGTVEEEIPFNKKTYQKEKKEFNNEIIEPPQSVVIKKRKVTEISRDAHFLSNITSQVEANNDKQILSVLLQCSLPRDLGLSVSYFIKYYRRENSDGIYVFVSKSLQQYVFGNLEVLYLPVKTVEKALNMKEPEYSISDNICIQNPNVPIPFYLRNHSLKVKKMFKPFGRSEDEGWVIGMIEGIPSIEDS